MIKKPTYIKYFIILYWPSIHVTTPPPSLREIWCYREANSELTRRSIKEFDWERAFSNTSVNEKIDIFNRTALNIFSNLFPHEIIVCDGKDPPDLTVE